MKTVAIICEYNPFHTGHEYQINKIRDNFGDNTRIIAIMSGNFMQRGDLAIIDKAIRARHAVECGANLVLEFPFPYSMSSAEIFAKSGLKIVDSLKIVDTLVFGSESGDIHQLTEFAEKACAKEYKNQVADMLKSDNYANIGYPKICELAYKAVWKKDYEKNVLSPNNILGIEYIKAIKELNSSIQPYTIKRVGAGYSENNIRDTKFQSATAIRQVIKSNFNSALDFIPEILKNAFTKDCENGYMICEAERLASAVISHFRTNPTCNQIHDTDGGLYNRLYKQSFNTNTITELTALAGTKKYTTARIKRAIWYSFFGVTSSIMKELPYYTQVLALDSVGQAILKDIKKRTDFPILTKPSATKSMPNTAKRQKDFSDMADSVFQLTKPTFCVGDITIKISPYIKTSR